MLNTIKKNLWKLKQVQNYLYRMMLIPKALFILLMGVYSSGYADYTSPHSEASRQSSKKAVLEAIQRKMIPPELIGGGVYDSFKFNSTNSTFYNRYYGHTKQGYLGGGNLYFHDVLTGVNVNSINTNVKSNSLLSSANAQINNTNITNTSINLYAMSMLSSYFSLQVLGGVGQSNSTINSTLAFPGTTFPNTSGSASFDAFNEYIGGHAIFSRHYRKVMLQGDIGYVFSNFEQPAYSIAYDDGATTQVLSLITRIGLLTETARISYQLYNNVQPFVTAGLIQVASRSFSNPVTPASATTASPLPQLLIGNSGFDFGAGLVYQYKKLRLTPYYQYSQRGTNYFDNLGALNVSIVLN